MNVTLIIFTLVTLLLCIQGYKKGMTKVLSNLVAWIVALLVICLIVVIYVSFKIKDVKVSAVSIIILLLTGFIYGIIHFVFKSIRMIARLPMLRLLDQLLGLVVGLAEGVILIWAVYILKEAGLLGNFGVIIDQDMANSQLLSLLYHYNYLVKLIFIIKIS